MSKFKKNEGFDDYFQKLAAEVTRRIEANKDGTDQKQQVEELLDAEIKFKETIIKYRQSTKVYMKFWNKVCVTNKNILSARPYFRETAVNFSKKITPAIKVTDIETIKTFDINYQLIKFIRDNWEGPFPARAEQLFHRLHKAREVLIQNNMPLAINRAKLFYRKTPKSHLTLMDMIGICGMGLAAGIDKWCGKYTPVFRSVCIGRMVGNLIDSYSETMLHFYPSDRRVLYKANIIRSRRGIDEIHALTAAVNQSFKDDGKEGKSIPKNEVTVSELSYLMSAASTVSADHTVSVDDEGSFGVYDYTVDPTQDIEGDYVARETTAHMLALAQNLPLLHRKVLKLKGIKL
jgi:DNA-directed RNA polymerase specialized sigma subunit